MEPLLLLVSSTASDVLPEAVIRTSGRAGQVYREEIYILVPITEKASHCNFQELFPEMQRAAYRWLISIADGLFLTQLSRFIHNFHVLFEEPHDNRQFQIPFDYLFSFRCLKLF